MLKVLIYFFIALSLSTDAFSIAISMGTLLPKRNDMTMFSIIVGIFHFIMPIIGNSIGSIFMNKLIVGTNYITFFIFLILGIEMYKNKNSEERITIINKFTFLLIAFSVSIDSFTVGIIYGLNHEKIILASTIFCIISSIATFIGLNIGKKLKDKYQEKAINAGIILIFLISLKYLFDI